MGVWTSAGTWWTQIQWQMNDNVALRLDVEISNCHINSERWLYDWLSYTLSTHAGITQVSRLYTNLLKPCKLKSILYWKQKGNIPNTHSNCDADIKHKIYDYIQNKCKIWTTWTFWQFEHWVSCYNNWKPKLWECCNITWQLVNSWFRQMAV